MSNLILEVEVRCHKVQGMTEAFMDTLYSRAKTVQFTKKRCLPLFSSKTADKFAKDYAIKKKLPSCPLYALVDYSNTVDQVQFEFHDFIFG